MLGITIICHLDGAAALFVGSPGSAPFEAAIGLRARDFVNSFTFSANCGEIINDPAKHYSEALTNAALWTSAPRQRGCAKRMQ
jgi:hypothetical protein